MMKMLGLAVLLLIGIAGFAFGGLVFAHSESAVHEIEALICFLIGTVGLGFAVMIASLAAVRDEIEVSALMRTRAIAAPASDRAEPK